MRTHGLLSLVTGTVLLGLSLGSHLGCGGGGGHHDPVKPPVPPAQAPAIQAHPVDVVAGMGAEATFTVTASGEPKPTYQWFKGTPDAGQELPGAKAATYTHPPVTTADHGQTFFVKVTNSVATAVSNIATLTVAEKPVITKQPVSSSGQANTEFHFSCAAMGAQPLSCHWERSEDRGMTWVAIPGATGQKYSFIPEAKDLQARFRAVVSNGLGSVTSDPVKVVATVLKDRFPSGLNGSAKINSTSITANPGTQVAFSFPLGDPGLTYQWQRSENQGGTWADIQGAVQPEYVYTLQPRDKGIQFRAVTKGPQGTTVSNLSKALSANS